MGISGMLPTLKEITRRVRDVALLLRAAGLPGTVGVHNLRECHC